MIVSYYKLSLLLLLLGGWVLFRALVSPLPSTGGILLGKNLPDFNLATLHTQAMTQRDDLPDGPFILNVWASWCPGCLAEHGYLTHLHESAGAVIVGVNYRDKRESALAWLEQYGDPYALHLYDHEASLSLDLGVSGAPETFVVDGDGIVRHHHLGVLSERVVMEWDVRFEAQSPAGAYGRDDSVGLGVLP